jgi:hypothetical protein
MPQATPEAICLAFQTFGYNFLVGASRQGQECGKKYDHKGDFFKFPELFHVILVFFVQFEPKIVIFQSLQAIV